MCGACCPSRQCKKRRPSDGILVFFQCPSVRPWCQNAPSEATTTRSKTDASQAAQERFLMHFRPSHGSATQISTRCPKKSAKTCPGGRLGPPQRAKNDPGAAQHRPGSPPGAPQECPGSVSRCHLQPKRAPRAFQSLLQAAREGISAPFRHHFDQFWSRLGILFQLFFYHCRWRLVLACVSVLLLAFCSLLLLALLLVRFIRFSCSLLFGAPSSAKKDSETTSERAREYAAQVPRLGSAGLPKGLQLCNPRAQQLQQMEPPPRRRGRRICK